MKLGHVLLLALFTFTLSCGGPNHADNPIMQKAFAIHQESSKTEKDLAPKLEDLLEIKNGTNITGRALTKTEIDRIKKIEQIENSLKFWQKNIPDVPGFEHKHHAHEGPCSHGTGLDILPEDWVEVQQEFKDSILIIKERIEAILQQI